MYRNQEKGESFRFINDKSSDIYEDALQSIHEEQESLKSRGCPYWYTYYIQSKRHEQLISKTPTWIKKTSVGSSDSEVDPAERNISRLPTSSEDNSPNNRSENDEDYTHQNSQQMKCDLTPTVYYDQEEVALKDTRLPDIIMPIRRSMSFPRLSCCRKVENINIVLPKKPSPLPHNEPLNEKKAEKKEEKDEKVEESFSDEIIEELPNEKQNFPEANDDELFYGRTKHYSKNLNDKSNILPPVVERSFYGNLSTTMNTINSVTSDFDVHVRNILAASTPKSSAHALNILVEDIKERRDTSRWITKLRSMISNAPQIDRRKSQPLLGSRRKSQLFSTEPKDRRMSQPFGTEKGALAKEAIKENSPIKNNSPRSLSSSSSRFSGIINIFRKMSPKKPKNKRNTSMMISQKAFLPVTTKRYSLDPQTIRKWNDSHEELDM